MYKITCTKYNQLFTIYHKLLFKNLRKLPYSYLKNIGKTSPELFSRWQRNLWRNAVHFKKLVWGFLHTLPIMNIKFKTFPFPFVNILKYICSVLCADVNSDTFSILLKIDCRRMCILYKCSIWWALELCQNAVLHSRQFSFYVTPKYGSSWWVTELPVMLAAQCI